MINFYDGQITDILPENFSSRPDVQALSYALREGTRMLFRYAHRMYVYTDIDSQPEQVLDLLAAELRTQYYKDTLNIETKRRLVKNTLAWYMNAGTPQAVEELVKTVFGEGEVKEWFEYGGDPYYFKIATDAALTPETDAFFSIMLRWVKNARSHLQVISVERTAGQELYAGAGQFPRYRPAAVMEGFEAARQAVQEIRTRGAVTTISGYKSIVTEQEG